MSAFHALDAARAAGIEVRLDGKDLLLSADGEPPADLLDMLRRHKRSILGLLEPTLPWDATDWRAYRNERAAIAEFDGQLPRLEAEAVAFECCVAEWLYRNAATSAAGPCPICGDRLNELLVPVGLAGAGEVWLHVKCSATWSTTRKAEAVADLAAMGISSVGSAL